VHSTQTIGRRVVDEQRAFRRANPGVNRGNAPRRSGQNGLPGRSGPQQPGQPNRQGQQLRPGQPAAPVQPGGPQPRLQQPGVPQPGVQQGGARQGLQPQPGLQQGVPGAARPAFRLPPKGGKRPPRQLR